MQIQDPEDRQYAQFGRASLIPGIQKAIECLQEMLFTLQTLIAAGEAPFSAGTAAAAGAALIERKASQPAGEKKPAKRGAGVKKYWAQFSKAERSAMIAGRMKKRAVPHQGGNGGGAGNKNHPRHPDHPGHKAWLNKIAKVKAQNKAKAATA